MCHPEITIQQDLLANISSCMVIHVVIFKPTIKPFMFGYKRTSQMLHGKGTLNFRDQLDLMQGLLGLNTQDNCKHWLIQHQEWFTSLAVFLIICRAL